MTLPLAAGIAFLCLFLQHYQGNNVWDLYYRMSLILVFLLYAVILFRSNRKKGFNQANCDTARSRSPDNSKKAAVLWSPERKIS